MMLDYSCLQGQSLSICDHRSIVSAPMDERTHRVFVRSPNYPNEYENALNCSCDVEASGSTVNVLDFALEERDETNQCSRDYLQVDDRSYCDAKLEPSSMRVNASARFTFKTNDVITRKGFWLMIHGDQSIRVTCGNSPRLVTPSTTTTTTTTTSTRNASASNVHRTRHHTLSFVLLLIIIFVGALVLLNLLLLILCYRQRRSKDSVNSKTSSTCRPFFRPSKRSSTLSSSSSTYRDTPIPTAFDTQKRTSSKFALHPRVDTTPSTSVTTGTYEDPNEFRQKLDFHPSVYFRHEPNTFCPIVLSSAPMHCHCQTAAQSCCPYDSQHVYETIKDGYCSYQRFAATLRRQQQQQQETCSCYCSHQERTNEFQTNLPIESTPETLV